MDNKSGLAPSYIASGDRAVLAQFAAKIEPGINRYIHSLCRMIDSHPLKGIVEYQPSYRCLIVYYDPLLLCFDEVTGYLEKIRSITGAEEELPSNLVEIPVCYGGAYGPDLAFVADYLGIPENEVVESHTAQKYLVYFLGFAPCFPMLQAPDGLAGIPRLDSPRIKVPAGSVGMVGNQTGVYPNESPGGWRLIGRTSMKLYDAKREEPFLVRPGDYIRFRAVSEKEFEAGCQSEN